MADNYKPMSRIITIILILFFFPTNTNAQNIIVEGVIKDSERKEILPFANIYLQNNYLGTISNEKGAFKITISSDIKNDSLVISYIGYNSQKISIASIKSPIEVFLVENQVTLDEVIVTGYTANSIIEKAISKIPQNYYQEPYKSKGFYRVTSQKDNNYIHLSEAVFDIYQSKINNPKQQFKLEKMRAIKDEKASKGIDLGLKPNGIYEFDIVNNMNDIGLLNRKGLKLHTFKIDGSEFINDRETYKITFDQKNTKKAGYKGYMLIDKETFAFVYFDFQLSPKGVSYYKFGDASTRALMKIVGINIDMNRNNYQISYKQFGNKYYLNNIGNDATLTFKSNREHYNFKTDTRVDYLVTKIEIENIKQFTNEETLGQGKLIEEQNSIYDADFWKNYNIVLPTSDFNEIASKLEAKNKANDIKIEIEEQLNNLPKDKSIRIDSILSFYNNKDLFNGTVLITSEGKTIHQKSYNNTITDNKLNSQFRIGSLSKTFTSMIIAQLENENKLKYDDSISKYLPNYKNGDITIHQLLSHQSGIPNFLANGDYLKQIFTEEYTLEELVNLFCSDTLEFQSGTKFEYSNSNFVILSLIAERILKKKYKDILNQYIFKSLNMSDTYFGNSIDNTNLVTGFMYGKPEPKYYFQNVGGAGGITSTTADLLKWSNAIDTTQLLPTSKIEQILEPKTEYNDWDAYYGYGWMIDRYMFHSSKRHKIYYHPGTDFGFYSMFVKQPDNGITIILLNNTGEFPRFEITELILNELN
jgi:CubicO group peptidase (beta-lactamase class C family)